MSEFTKEEELRAEQQMANGQDVDLENLHGHSVTDKEAENLANRINQQYGGTPEMRAIGGVHVETQNGHHVLKAGPKPKK